MADVVDPEPNVYFTEWPTFIWKVVGFLQKISQMNPVECDFRGLRFQLDLDLSFRRFYNEDTYNLRIVANRKQIPDEFEEFQVSTCVVDKFGKEHFSSDVTVTHNTLVAREPIWTTNRMELFLKYDELTEPAGEEEILTLKCAFLPKRRCENTGVVEDEASGAGFRSEISCDFLKLFRKCSSVPDLVLKCQGYTYRVHRLIISTRCRVYLDKLLQLGRGLPVVEIDNMNPGILTAIVEFIYAGILPDLNLEVACELYSFGVEYSMEDLAGMCRKYLVESLSNENACRMLTIAAKNGDSLFKVDVTKFIIKNPGILLSDNWDDVEPLLACGVYYAFLLRYDSVFLS